MNEMWAALQWVYDNYKIPASCRKSWATMLTTKTHVAFADAIADADAAAAAAAAISIVYCTKLGYTREA